MSSSMSARGTLSLTAADTLTSTALWPQRRPAHSRWASTCTMAMRTGPTIHLAILNHLRLMSIEFVTGKKALNFGCLAKTMWSVHVVAAAAKLF